MSGGWATMPGMGQSMSIVLLLQRVAGDGSERWQWWFWGVFVVIAIVGMTIYTVMRWKMDRGE